MDTFHYLSAALRDKSGLDGDGAALVGQALGGESPRIRVNSLQTESERNVQKGAEQIVRGLYLGIRNPRSHDQMTDNKVTADAIIVFVDYLLGVLEAAREAFTHEAFIARVMDQEFVDSERYADLLVAEIPALRRGEALIAIYQERTEIDLQKTSKLIEKLIAGLSDAQSTAYLAIVSEELRTTTEDRSIRTSLRMLTPVLWPRLDEVARLRIETKLIKGLGAGKCPAGGKVTEPLATWSSDFLKVFTLRDNAENTISCKLAFGDQGDLHYIARYFLRDLPDVILSPFDMDVCVDAISGAIKANDDVVRSHLLRAIPEYPKDWQEQLAAALKSETDPNNPAIKLHDGTQFLSSPARDDVPF